jgi:glutamate:Na+ symporter, ESS family
MAGYTQPQLLRISPRGIIGGPIGTYLVRRSADGRVNPTPLEQPVAQHVVEAELPPSTSMKVKATVAILFAMWMGAWVSIWLVQGAASMGFTVALPGAHRRDARRGPHPQHRRCHGRLGLSQRTIDDLGFGALSLFLAMALMRLKLWELVGLATPLAIMLVAQITAVALMAVFLVWRLMEGNYEAAVMSGGFIGFMLGTTANAMANITALVERYGPAPKAFLVVPMIGAFFIDFTNALIITVFLNWFG